MINGANFYNNLDNDSCPINYCNIYYSENNSIFSNTS
jgi:hypothetical protein